MGQWSREELQAAHDNYKAVAKKAAATQEWDEWAQCFTEDARYLEHHYGEMHGREAIREWISTTMSQWPNSEMDAFPHDWCVCDEERGWWICQIQNRMRDLGDDKVRQAANITILHYAGNMQWNYEEDAYNPANFGPMVKDWIVAERSLRAGE